MIFQVIRTSDWNDEKPFDACIPIKLTKDVGFEDVWGIEINSLEELINFKNAVGADLVIQTSWVDDKTPCIEIYDYYRE